MKKIAVICLSIVLTLFGAKKKNIFKGTWCIGEERLMISFKGNDSITVLSGDDESVKGSGKYEYTDTTFSATIYNGDLKMQMIYRYKLTDNGRLKAKIKFFTVNGDSVDYPRRWLRMERCDPDEFIKNSSDSANTNKSDAVDIKEKENPKNE